MIGCLFSGYGGLSMAVGQTLGMEVQWHAEVEPAACRVLNRHWSDTPNLGDVSTVDWDMVAPVDVITAGYPCQPFSKAGKRKGADDDRHLWPHVRDAVGALRPRLVVLENVRGHLTLGAASVVADLAALGYVGSWTTLAASEVGAPHRRERWFCVAHPDGEGPQGGGRSVGQGSHLRWARRGGGVPAALLPTPTTEPQTGNGHARNLGAEVKPGRWGDYADAIARWEPIVGRPAPDPTEPGKNGKPRLSPRFVEWLMGLPEGHVCDTPDVSRTQALKMLGNGVVVQQASEALRRLLSVAEEVAA